jgi:hypothetical protein
MREELMRLTRVAFKLVAAALAILGVEALGTSVATADTTIPNQYDLVPASASGLNTFIRDTGNPRTGQVLIHANQLTGAVGQNITGIAFRLFTGATAPFPATPATWADYTIRVGPGVAFGSQTTTFATNFSAPPTIVRTGPLTLPAGALSATGSPKPFGPFITFTTPFLYSGGNLLIEIRHPGSNIVNNAASDFLEVATTLDPGFNVQFWSATATGAAATTGAIANFTVVRLQTQGAVTIDIGDSTVVEGDAGPVSAGFPVTLSAPSAGPVTVNFATANGTATAGTDYTATSGTLTFAPGTTSQIISVSVTGDVLDELDETYFVNLSAPTGGSIGDGQGLGTIIDDDGPTINIGDATVTEGDAGTVDAAFAVTLSASSPGPVTVAFATADGTATAPGDYTPTTGVLTFAPGTTALAVTVSVIGDVLDENDETYFVNLSAPTGGDIGDGQGLGTIIDDDGVAADTTGELRHGTRITGDLAAGPNDTDDYAISQKPFSSYEVVVDAASGDISPVNLDRRADAGTTIVQNSQPISGNNTARSLRWANDTSSTVDTQTVRVASGGCTTDCGADDTYRLRAYETTGAVPRFNNSGTQITVLLLQNPTDYAISANVYFWDSLGTQLHVEPVNIAPKNLLVLNTASIVAVNGQSGAVTVTHNGRFGDLAGKTVALEPATGFSFDSPMLTRTR